ncbi:predicted protein, partial [Nematostella vectensis]
VLLCVCTCWDVRYFAFIHPSKAVVLLCVCTCWDVRYFAFIHPSKAVVLLCVCTLGCEVFCIYS